MGDGASDIDVGCTITWLISGSSVPEPGLFFFLGGLSGDMFSLLSLLSAMLMPEGNQGEGRPNTYHQLDSMNQCLGGYYFMESNAHYQIRTIPER